MTGEARNIHKSFFIKNHYQNFKLPIVALSSIIKCSHQKCKKNHQRDASFIAEVTRKTLKRGKMKNEKCYKSLITTIKFFTFIFCNSSLLKANFHVTVVRGWKRSAPSQQPNGSDSDDVLRPNQSLMEKTSYANYRVVRRVDPQPPAR